MDSNIKHLIVKFFMKEATREELEQLAEWIRKPKNEQLFYDYVKTNAFIDTTTRKYDSEKAKKRIMRHILGDKNVFFNRRINNVLKYAAVLVLAFGIFYFFQNQSIIFNKPSTVISNINNKSEKVITLTLNNGIIETINEDDSIQIMNAKGHVIGSQNRNTLTYNNDDSISETLSYNTLKVPYGKMFDLELSDGTKVKLNAGSSIKYPVKFIAGLNREVFLEGEAFFDVVKDIENPFIVNMNDIGIRVLGTKFNASSYPEDDQINTVLVEGSVNIYKTKNANTQNTATLLRPNQIASWSKINKQIVIEETDVDIHTAWMHGRIRFRHLTFAKIAKKLERKYDVVIVNNNKALNEEMFTASFDVEPIEEVLNVFHNNYDISYTINNNLIIIN